ncbi:MAG: hypothetical protein FJ271_19505 [Planctomycetes bacterium]|nr:hypothetical protein [Planctomycetota bacterium]
MTRVFGVLALLTASAIVFAQTGEEKKGKRQRDPEAMFKRLDKDGDGKLTRAEYEAMFEKLGERGEKIKEGALKRFDKAAGKEKYLTLDQFKKLQGGQGGGGGFNAEAIFKKLDADGNGKLSKAEYETMLTRMYDRLKDKIGEEKADKFKASALKRFDDAAGKDGTLTLEQFQKLQSFGRGELKGKGKNKRKKNDL